MYSFVNIKNGAFYMGDCLEVMRDIPDGVIDMVLCDLPYGTTACKWDSIISFDELWAQYKRIIKPNGAIVLTAAQPFTSALVMSNADWFKYDWTWKKPKGTGHLNAKKQPMRDKEDILVFCNGTPIYNPQMMPGKPYKAKSGKTQFEGYGVDKRTGNDNDGLRYPKQVLEFTGVERGTLHPTQKPVALFEYLIKTYTNAGDIVLDNCAGSGTTAIASENCGRRWVCVEQDKDYANKAVDRIFNHEVVVNEAVA